MERFIIEKLEASFEERWATVRKIDDGREFCIYFLEFSESLNPHETITKRKIGDIIEGNLFIAWITRVEKVEKVDSSLMYIQDEKYSTIKAIVEITKMINKRTFFVKNNIVDREIVIKTEQDIDLKKGDRIFIGGSLQLELEEYKDQLELLEY